MASEFGSLSNWDTRRSSEFLNPAVYGDPHLHPQAPGVQPTVILRSGWLRGFWEGTPLKSVKVIRQADPLMTLARELL